MKRALGSTAPPVHEVVDAPPEGPAEAVLVRGRDGRIFYKLRFVSLAL